VRSGDIVAGGADGRVVVLRNGQPTRTLYQSTDGTIVSSLSVSADGRLVAVGRRYSCSTPSTLVDVVSGETRDLGDNVNAPALSPDGKYVAFARVEESGDVCFRTAIVVHELSSGSEVAVDIHDVLGTPPELVINWSADGKRLAFVDRSQLPAHGHVRVLRFEPGSLVDDSTADPDTFSPVFDGAGRLLVEQGCCVRPMSIVSASDGHVVIDSLDGPIESIRLATDGVSVVAVDALHQMWSIDGNGVAPVANGYLAAA